MYENITEILTGPISAEKIAQITDGELVPVNGGHGSSESVISTDSRTQKPHGIFAAITGERNDGHKYILNEIERGVGIIIAERIPDGETDAPADFVIVENTTSALLSLARYCIDISGCKRIAVTGSVGKTTTKEFISSVLSQEYKTSKTEGNKNTAIGTALTAFEISWETQCAVFECGMSGRGEISEMVKTIRPDIGVITNIGTAHMEMLGSRENIASAKLELLDGMDEDAPLLINGDEPLLTGNERVKARKNVLTVAMYNRHADVRALNLRMLNGGMLFDIICRGRVITNVEIPVPGMHNIYNAVIAFTVGDLCDVSEEKIRAGLKNFINVSMRQKIYRMGKITIIDDAYNASPESMRAALNVLSSMTKERGARAVALLGDMKELGDSSSLMHEKIGAYAARSGVKLLFTYGVLAENIARSAIRNGIRAENVHVNLDTGDARTMAEMMAPLLRADDVLLVKASRSVHAENVIEQLKKFQKRFS
ncbi:MAG: UDP-N-acetylmuramoyl-tripeptide--D-alanyl-D-alanine ligase [Clostridiales bacterium]|nr:UDP-N-acetylmuramoyl-tripeptide--D-alanyl-D-alanine ligase [Clostridiales bacterium]